jgi:hypothetical protein
MNGGIVSMDRLPVEGAALSEGSPDFDGPPGNLSGTTGFARHPQNPRSVLFRHDTLAGVGI